MNWISATGRIPPMAKPRAAPTIPDSATGVSTTRSSPWRRWSPSVTRNTPPARPTSSPSTITRGSLASATSSAWLMACAMLRTTMESDRTGRPLRQLPLLLPKLGRHLGEHRLEDLAGLLGRQGLRGFNRRLDGGPLGLLDLALPSFVPAAVVCQPATDQVDRITPSPLRLLVRVALPLGVARRG